MADLSQIPVLVPDDVEDASDLPLALLDSASNHLKCDLVEAVRGNVDGKRYAAWAELAYQWARHTGVEKPDRETYRRYSVLEVSHALGWDREEEEVPDPTGPAPTVEPSNESPSLASSGVSPTISREFAGLTTP